MISELISALRAGEELKDATKWKNLQATTADIQAVFGAVIVGIGLVGVHLDISAEQLAALAGGVAAVLGVYNSYFTRATSTRIGLSSDGAPDVSTGVSDGGPRMPSD